MTGTKKALLIGYNYESHKHFSSVPAEDNIEKLKPVLKNREIGNFEVWELLDKPLQETTQELEKFFRDGRADDLLLLYFSGHGVLHPREQQLYLATHGTDPTLLRTTAISARDVKNWMEHARSKRIAVLLDCCYGGAITRSVIEQGDPRTENALERLSGEGRIIIAAADRLEIAHDSIFTDAVVKGLDTGEADLNGDGDVSVDELYAYVHHEVQKRHRNQRPIKHGTLIGDLILATNRYRLLPLPPELEQHLNDQDPQKRIASTHGLRFLIAGDFEAGLKRAARRELHRLSGADPDTAVREAARRVLPSAVPPRVAPPETRRQRWIKSARALTLVTALVCVPPAVVQPPHPPTSGLCTPIVKQPNGVLSLGTLLPNNTGAFVYTGPALNAGVQLAMKDVSNYADGIPGIDVKLDAGNQKDEGDPAANTASRSIDELLSNQVDVIIGPATSAVGHKIIDKTTCAGVILFSPSNTSQLFTTYPDHGLYFRTSPPATVEGTALGRLVVADHNSTVVVMSRNDEYGNDLREATVAEIRKSRVRVVDSFHYEPNSADYSKDIQRIKSQNPDAIVLIGFSESARILAGMIQNGLGPQRKRVYGTISNLNNSLSAQVRSQNPGVLAGMKGTVPDPGDVTFVKRLLEEHPGLRSLNFAAQAYDAVIITALAAATAGTDAPAAIASKINDVTRGGTKCYSFRECMTLVRNNRDIAYVGPSGPLDFSDSGEPISGTYLIGEIQPDGTVKIPGKESGGP
ncbi:MAG TPA: ABC transporter substrate-binding protein [Pseudonocardiaceae bacterium]|nr:ABC transporter substrate-binding protein [Pseudonocardiaceae bacterium]